MLLKELIEIIRNKGYVVKSKVQDYENHEIKGLLVRSINDISNLYCPYSLRVVDKIYENKIYIKYKIISELAVTSKNGKLINIDINDCIQKRNTLVINKTKFHVFITSVLRPIKEENCKLIKFDLKTLRLIKDGYRWAWDNSEILDTTAPLTIYKNTGNNIEEAIFIRSLIQ